MFSLLFPERALVEEAPLSQTGMTNTDVPFGPLKSSEGEPFFSRVIHEAAYSDLGVPALFWDDFRKLLFLFLFSLPLWELYLYFLSFSFHLLLWQHRVPPRSIFFLKWKKIIPRLSSYKVKEETHHYNFRKIVDLILDLAQLDLHSNSSSAMKFWPETNSTSVKKGAWRGPSAEGSSS